MSLTPEQAVTIREDFLLWCDHLGIALFDWQRQAFGEALRREGGKFRYRIAAISVPRGNGKSKGGAICGAYVMTTRRKPHVLSSALGIESAGVTMQYARDLFKTRRGARVLTNEIRVASNDARWTITSREHTSSRGLHPDLILYDEIGWAADDELFASLLAGQASVDDPLMLVISTVGKRRSGPLWQVKELASGGDPAVLFWYSDQNLSPKVTVDFLARQKRILMRQQYAREHQNQWVDSADSFTSADEVDPAMNQGWTEQHVGDPTKTYHIFGDLGAMHDPSVIGLGHSEGLLFYIDKLITFQGSREEPVKLAVVEQTIRDLSTVFNVTKIRIESWQGISAVQSLKGLGLPVELFAPTAKAHAEEWPVLAQALSSRTLVLFPHARLREELLGLSYDVGPQGVRVTDKGSVHQDHAVAVRGVVASLAKASVRVPFMFGNSDTGLFATGKTPEQVQQELDDALVEAAADSKTEIEQTIALNGTYSFGDEVLPPPSPDAPPKKSILHGLKPPFDFESLKR